MALDELPDWQCCGATFPLATDNAMTLIAPTRVLIEAEKRGDRLATLCAICYNVLRRTNALLGRQPEMLERINWFVSSPSPGDTQGPGDGAATYHGGVKVVHFLEMLRDDLGWGALGERVARASGKDRLRGLRVAPYYGCLLLRPPSEMGLDDPDSPVILSDFLRALGAEPIGFAFQNECCGSYLAASQPEVPKALAGTILAQAVRAGAQAIITACPLCQYNLDKRAASGPSTERLPILYFTQLLVVALGLPEETWGFDGHLVDPHALFG
jgi:heterodisulfide reductase subunit B